MLEDLSEIKDNFTVIFLKWFKELAKVDCYDARNEDSVFLARTISAHFSDEMLVTDSLDKSGIPQQMDCNYRKDKDMQILLKNYLIIADSFEPFIGHMLYAHRTLQQDFSRFCLDWFEAVAVNEKGQEGYIRLAQLANQHKTNLRYI